MPSRGIPQSFWLTMVFGLLGAGIIALVGFAIDKADEKDAHIARAGAEEAIVAQLESGRITLADLDETDPLRIRLEAEGQEAPEVEQVAATPLEPVELVDGDPTLGQQLFFQNGCQACHGETGEGGIGPTIAQTGFSLAQQIDQYRNPRDVMPQQPPDLVSDQDIAHIHAWLQTLPLPATIVPGEGTPQ
ncbi:MAG: cytochrome c [Chloroflexota bacterium]|nr:cytochrome c [Chloroflexota bacterium]